MITGDDLMFPAVDDLTSLNTLLGRHHRPPPADTTLTAGLAALLDTALQDRRVVVRTPVDKPDRPPSAAYTETASAALADTPRADWAWYVRLTPLRDTVCVQALGLPAGGDWATAEPARWIPVPHLWGADTDAAIIDAVDRAESSVRAHQLRLKAAATVWTHTRDGDPR
jgi:hypothetical protein